jgi:hypothetical protein
MHLLILQNTSVNELQTQFQEKYPFLKIEFMQKNNKPAQVSSLLKNLNEEMTGGIMEISDNTTVSELELLFKQFGLPVQVRRRSGNVWLQPIMTEHWTLNQQNRHGKEISN